MSDIKGAKMLNIHQVIAILIIAITDFSIKDKHVLYNYGLIITKRIFF